MKKKQQWLILLPLALCALLCGAYMFMFVMSDDLEPPVISMDQKELEVSVNAMKQQLLSDVKAWDEVDGNVSEQVVIESISALREDHTAEIVYAAFDQSGNVSKASRTIRYTDYQSPRFEIKKPLIFTTSSTMDVISCMSASDVLDGDISRKIKGTLISDTNSLSYAGVHEVQFRVTNSMGDTVYLKLPVDVFEPNTYNATLELNDYLVYLPLGSEFDSEVYLSTLKIGASELALDGSDSKVRLYINHYVDPSYYIGSGAEIVNAEVQSDVNTSVPGVYSVLYSVTLKRGSQEYTGFSRLNVVVEESDHE